MTGLVVDEPAGRESDWLSPLPPTCQGSFSEVTAAPPDTVWSPAPFSKPTVQMPVVASLLPLLPGDQTPVAFKFTVTGSADWHMDDVHVDPWRCC